MSSRLSSNKSSSYKSSRLQDQQHSGWNLNPQQGLSDIMLNYQTDQIQKQSISPPSTPITHNSIKSPQSPQPLLSQQSSSQHSNISPTQHTFTGYSNQSPMMLSNLSFKTQVFDFFHLNKIKSEADESQYQKHTNFKKFKTESLLPEQMTEPELRMQNRYWNKLKNDYLKMMDDERMLEKKMEFVQAKTKINQLTLQKNERKKIHHYKINEVNYQQKPKEQLPMRSLSLPLIKSKIIDLGSKQILHNNKTELRQNLEAELHKLNRMNSSQNKFKKPDTLVQKCHCKPKKVKGKVQKDTNQECSTVQQIEDLLRKNGVNFDVNNIKKGLIQSMKSQELISFPSKSLISNPIYRKWGL